MIFALHIDHDLQNGGWQLTLTEVTQNYFHLQMKIIIYVIVSYLDCVCGIKLTVLSLNLRPRVTTLPSFSDHSVTHNCHLTHPFHMISWSHTTTVTSQMVPIILEDQLCPTLLDVGDYLSPPSVCPDGPHLLLHTPQPLLYTWIIVLSLNSEKMETNNLLIVSSVLPSTRYILHLTFCLKVEGLFQYQNRSTYLIKIVFIGPQFTCKVVLDMPFDKWTNYLASHFDEVVVTIVAVCRVTC